MMALSSSNRLTDAAIRAAAAGLGAAVGGPLGGAIGAGVGIAFGAAGAELVRTCTEKFGEEALKKLGDTGADSLLEKLKPSAPDLKSAYREAFRLSLSNIRSQISTPGEHDYEDWFANWDVCLKASGTLSLEEIRPGQLAPQNLNNLFRITMERLDGQGKAIRHRSQSMVLDTRDVPEPLLDEITTRLPDHFKENFGAIIVQPKYEQAWKQAEIVFRDSLNATLGLIDARTAVLPKVAEDTAAIREGLTFLQTLKEQFLERYDEAVKRGFIAELKVQELEAERVRQAEELRKLQQQLAARSAEPAEAELSGFLDAGDLDAALRLKSRQVEKRREDAATLPRDLYELGTIHELRFEWPQAFDAYREAWKLGKTPDAAFKYGYFAQKLNHFDEAITAYEAVLDTSPDPAGRASTLHNLADLYSDTQRMEEAEKAYDEALAIRWMLDAANPGAFLPGVAATLNNLGTLYAADTQRMKEAEVAFVRALAIRCKLAEANRLLADAYLPDVAQTLNNLALVYRATLRTKEAEKAYDEALAIQRRLAEANRLLADAYLPDVAQTLNNLAYMLLLDGRTKEAATHAAEAEGILDPLWQAKPAVHGNLMARILWTGALVSEAAENPASEPCSRARRALAAAYDPGLKQGIQDLIDRLCRESDG